MIAYLVNECMTNVTIAESIFLDNVEAWKHANEMQAMATKTKLNVEYRVRPIELWVGKKFKVVPADEPSHEEQN
jgi:hypothetical protein